MKVYIAKDWRGFHIFSEPPVLMNCGGMPDIWSGHRLPFNVNDLFDEDEIPKGQYIERNIFWSIVNILK